MRILFLSNVFPNPLNTGKGTFNMSLVRTLAQQHAVHVMSPVSWVDELTARWRGGDAFRACGATLGNQLTAEYVRYFYTPGTLRNQYGRFLWWSMKKTLQERMASFRPDAVVSYWAHPDGEVAVRAAREAGIPAIVMVGGSDVLLLTKEGNRRQAILKVLHDADAVVAVSHDIADRLRKDGIPAKKLHVVYRGVNRQVFHPGDQAAARRRLGLSNDRHHLVGVGRLVSVKGWNTLIDACGHLSIQNIPVECHILGSGPLERQLTKQLEEMGLQDRVHLRGAQKQTDLADWYRAADLTVLTSHSEGIPNVLLESMCCDTPFVATSVGGIPEIADPHRDRLVVPNDPAQLASAIAVQLDVPRLPIPRQFEPWTWEESARRLTSIIEGCGVPNDDWYLEPVEYEHQVETPVLAGC